MTDIRQQLATMLGDSEYAISLIESTDLDTDERASIPGWWIDALTQPSPSAALERALDEWETILPGRLPGFLAYAREHGQGLFLGRQDLDAQGDQIVLVYALADTTGEEPFYCWVGSLPLAEAAIPQHLQQLPNQLKAFHTQIHDEFRWALKIYGGILPVAELEPVSDYVKPGELRLINTDTEPDYTRVIAFYSDSTPKICAELSDNPDSVTGWYWPGGEIKLLDNYWQTLDHWLTLASKG